MGSVAICCYKQDRVIVNGCLKTYRIEDITEGEVVKRQTKTDKRQDVELASWICSLCNATS